MKYDTADKKAPSDIPCKRATILVIDDELGPRESLRMLLKDTYDLCLVESGEDGIERVKGGGIDLVILDLKMKKMGGIETLEKIKEVDPLVAVLILTGYGTLETAQKAIRFGACDYVKKPFDVTALLKTVQDNLKKKWAIESKEHATVRLKMLNDSLEKQIDLLKKFFESHKISHSFLHEICNSLTSVLGYVQLFLFRLEQQKDFTEEERLQTHMDLRIVERELERCRIMYRSFTGSVKQAPTQEQLLPLTAVIESCLSLLKPQIDKQGVTVEKDLDERCVMAKVAGSEYKQILLNLCINALNAMEDGGTLTICVECLPDGIANIKVTDTGCGIDEGIQSKVFEPYFTTSTSPMGSGLGLSICKGIIKKLEGSISIRSVKDRGTQVSIALPFK